MVERRQRFATRALARALTVTCAVGVAAFGVLATPVRAHAHPGWGIVRDAHGDVFYTDLVHVWRIDARGRKSIAVRDVHTHELMLDSAGALYGEDAEFLGGDRFRWRVWRRAPDGRVSDVIPWRDGSRDAWGFVRGGDGALYWASCVARDDGCVVKRRDARGRVSVAAGGARFGRPLNYLAAAADGAVLVADGSRVLRFVGDGRPTPVPGAVVRDTGRFVLMGLQAMPDGRVLVAAFAERAVVEIAPGGARRVLARSDAPWHPTGVLAAPDGLWILEYDDGARARVRHVSRGGASRTF